MTGENQLFDAFLKLSSVLTGFRTFDLRGTGQAETYYSTVDEIVGEEAKELLETFLQVTGDAGADEEALESGLRKQILSDPKLGPIARNIIKLWYVGIWYELPKEWREAYGENDEDRTFMISADSYRDGLLWPTIGANPSGAKPFGYGIWATPPRIEES